MRSFRASGVALSDSSHQVDIHIANGDFFLHMEQIQFNNIGTTWRKKNSFFQYKLFYCCFEQFLCVVLE